jgi:hypothetical protein
MTRLLITGGCGYFNIAVLDDLSLGRKRLPGAISREVYRGQYLQFRCRQRGGRKGVGDRPSCGRHMVVDSINNQRRAVRKLPPPAASLLRTCFSRRIGTS